MVVNNVLAGEDSYSILIEGDTNIYIRNSDDKLNAKRKLLGHSGEAFDIYGLAEDDKILARLKELNPSKVLIVYGTLSGLGILYRYLDISLGLNNIDVYLESLDFFSSSIDINCTDFAHYQKLDNSLKRVTHYKMRVAFYNKINDIINEHTELSFDYRNFSDKNIKATSHFMGSFMKMMFKEVEYTEAPILPVDIATWGGREVYEGKLRLFNIPAVKIYDRYTYPFDESIKSDRATILLKLDRPHWFSIIHRINFKAEELLNEQYPNSQSRLEAFDNIMDIMHPDDMNRYLKITITYEIVQKLIDKMLNKNLTFGISRLACEDIKNADVKTIILSFEYIEADKAYYKSEAEIYKALDTIMQDI